MMEQDDTALRAAETNDQAIAQVVDRITNGAWDLATETLSRLHPADIADIIDQAPSSTRKRIFSLLQEDLRPEVLAELADRSEQNIIESLTNHELSDIVEDMAPDDAADVLAALPEERSEEVLNLMEKEDSADVRQLLRYEEDTAGGIMTTEVVAMNENQSVEDALHAIAYMDTTERFFYAYIVTDDNRLVGYVDIWELLRERDRKRRLGDLVHGNVVSASVDMDQEAVAYLIGQYDLSSIPVVDHDGRLVGRITADDVLDVVVEEASEDIFKLAGSDEEDMERESALFSCWVRLPWLFVTLCGGFLTSLILKHFHVRISSIHVLVLAAFVPIVLAMGGNTGIQSSTLVVRRLALGDRLNGRRIVRLLLREVSVGALMGIICGTLIGLWARVLIGHTPGETGIASATQLAVVVGVALFTAMTFAAVYGAVAPIVLHRFKVDPAVASGPFVSISNDISALLIYFGVTLLLFWGLG